MNISLHRVSKIEVSSPSTLSTSDGQPFVMRTLTVFLSDGRRVEINLFADGGTENERLSNVEIKELVNA